MNNTTDAYVYDILVIAYVGQADFKKAFYIKYCVKPQIGKGCAIRDDIEKKANF